MLKYFILGFFFISASALMSQVNIKVGYGIGYFQASENNDILNEYNLLKEQELSGALSKSFSNLNSMSGISLGLRLKVSDVHSLEIGWENLSKSKEVIGETNSQSLFQQKLFYSSNQYYLMYQTHLDKLGFGLGMGYNSFIIKDEIGGSDIKKGIVSENQLMLRFNLAYYLKGHKNVSFSIQPYYNLALDNVPLNALRKELSLSEDQNVESTFSNFGLRFIFYNGAQ